MTKKRTIMRAFKIDEISGVDKPAQEHARMIICKRADPKTNNPKENNMPNKDALKNDDGNKDVKTQEQLDQAAAENTKLKDDLATANQVAGLNDAEKEIYNEGDDAAKKAFLAKSKDERTELVKKRAIEKADKNPVVYKSADGTEFRKSDDERLISFAKKADEAEKIAKAERELREGNELKKRALETFPNTPGDEDTKAAMLKAIESISDEKVRKAALESAIAGDKAIKAAFSTVGNPGRSGEALSAADELKKQADEYAATHKCTYEKAYLEVTKTAEGAKLFKAAGN